MGRVRCDGAEASCTAAVSLPTVSPQRQHECSWDGTQHTLVPRQDLAVLRTVPGARPLWHATLLRLRGTVVYPKSPRSRGERPGAPTLSPSCPDCLPGGKAQKPPSLLAGGHICRTPKGREAGLPISPESQAAPSVPPHDPSTPHSWREGCGPTVWDPGPCGGSLALEQVSCHMPRARCRRGCWKLSSTGQAPTPQTLGSLLGRSHGSSPACWLPGGRIFRKTKAQKPVLGV